MTGESVPATAPVHDGNEVATILLVTGMIEYRNRMIATLLDRFDNDSERLHRERRERGLKKRSQELVGIADHIHRLAQDNAYDIRNLMIHLERQEEKGCRASGNTGHQGQVCYIQ
jgi:hypothetical protein